MDDGGTLYLQLYSFKYHSTVLKILKHSMIETSVNDISVQSQVALKGKMLHFGGQNCCFVC